MDAEKKLKAKGILKKVGKVLVLVVITAAVAMGAVFGLAACNNNSSSATPTPVVTTMTVNEAFTANPTAFNNFVTPIVNAAKGDYKNSDVIYTAYDLGDKESSTIDDVTVYMAVKGTGNERSFVTKTATFDAVEAEQIKDGKGQLTNLVIEDAEVVTYNDTNFEQYAHLFQAKHDKVVKEFAGNQFTENQNPSYQPTIVETQTLLNDFSQQADTFANRVSQAVLNKYNYEDVVFCGCQFPNADSDGTISSMTVRVARKTGESERTISDYRVVFDPILLDDIAAGNYSFINSQSAWEEDIVYDAKTAENIDQYYDGYDSSYVEYVPETFEEQAVTIAEVLGQHADQVNANLESYYEGALKKAFGRYYGGTRYEVESYQWDLGEVTNGTVQNLKLTLNYYDNTLQSPYLRVYEVQLEEPATLNELAGAGQLGDATYTSVYSYSYDASTQGTRTELATAILENAINDGFDYQNAEIIFTETGVSTTQDLGTVKTFVIVVKNANGIREISATIQNASTDAELITKLQQGKGSTTSTEKTTYSQNMLDEYVATNDIENN